jgi:hypothetical protein
LSIVFAAFRAPLQLGNHLLGSAAAILSNKSEASVLVSKAQMLFPFLVQIVLRSLELLIVDLEPK